VAAPSHVAIADLERGRLSSLFTGRDHGATISIFITTVPPGDGPVLHRHPYEEIFVVEEGEAVFTADDRTIAAGAGEIVVVPAGAAHRFEGAGETSARVLSVHPSDHVVQEDL
jgi:quercetin dioxygenase-like cupin family protein